MAIETITIDNTQYDIYEIICETYGQHGLIHGNEITNRLLLTGEAGVDLRCILFSYSWDHNKEFAYKNLMDYDGRNENNDDFFVRTLNQNEILTALCKHVKEHVIGYNRDILSAEIRGQEENIIVIFGTKDKVNES